MPTSCCAWPPRAINTKMGELMEDHIRNHMPRNTKASADAAEDIVGMVRTYLD